MIFLIRYCSCIHLVSNFAYIDNDITYFHDISCIHLFPLTHAVSHILSCICIHRLHMHMAVCTENDASLKSTKSRNSDFVVSRGTNSN